MADNVSIKDASDASKPIATDEVGGAHHQLVKVEFGADGSVTQVSTSNPLPVALESVPLASGASTAAKQDEVLADLADISTALSAVVSALQATLDVAGSVSVANLPTTQPVSGSVSVSNFPATQPVSASSLPLPSGAATESTLASLSAKVPALSGGKTPVAIADTVSVSGPLTDTQLRASAVPVADSAVLAKLSSDPATQTTLAAVLAALQASLSVTFPSAQSVSISGTPTVALGNITNQTYAETTTALGSNATFTGSSRSAGSTTAYTRFIARALADQSGTFYIEYSPNNSTWYTHSSVAVTANTVAELACNVVTQYHRVRFVNGATAQGSLAIHSALVKV